MEWRSVQEDWPRAATSGGQAAVREEAREAADAVPAAVSAAAAAAVEVDVEESLEGLDFMRTRHEAVSVQVRQLLCKGRFSRSANLVEDAKAGKLEGKQRKSFLAKHLSQQFGLSKKLRGFVCEELCWTLTVSHLDPAQRPLVATESRRHRCCCCCRPALCWAPGRGG